MRCDTGSYEVRASIYNDSSAWTDTAWYTISDDWAALKIEWQAANSVANNDGYLKLWVDGVLVETIAEVDNDTHGVDVITLGARGIEAGTSGTFYIDPSLFLGRFLRSHRPLWREHYHPLLWYWRSKGR